MSYIAFYCIEFEDGSYEARQLHEGTEEECKNLITLLPAVNYSGSKHAVSAALFVWPKEKWNARTGSG